jgi:hypothetical protein
MFPSGHLELLTSFRGKVAECIDYGETLVGKRLDAYFEGDLTGGVLSGKMREVDYLLTRSDGVSEINVRAVIVTDDGVNLSVQISGYYCDRLIKDTHVKLLTGNERYRWLSDKIIVGKGRPTLEGLEVDYFYEP